MGDAFTFIAGVVRVRFWLFALLTSIGKGARYVILVSLITGIRSRPIREAFRGNLNKTPAA